MFKAHPLIPALDEATEIESGHLAVFTKVLIDDVQDNDLKMLSMNVMEAMLPINLKTEEGRKKETLRYQRIVEGLKRSADNLKLDVIVLQEVTSELMARQLMNTFGDEWGIQHSLDTLDKDRPQQLTLYRKSRLNLVESKRDSSERTLSTTFETGSGKTVHVHNVWTKFDSALPNKTEEYYRELLAKKNEDECAVILGDTNSRLAEVYGVLKNLTTSITPMLIHDSPGVDRRVQVPGHPEGGFYTDNKGRIRQLRTQTVDIKLGEVSEDHRIFSDVTEGMTANHRAIWQTPHPVLCLDNYYRETLLIGGGTIFDYEQDLRQKLNDDKILVRMSSTIFNEQGFVVSTETRIANLVLQLLPEQQIHVRPLESRRLIFVPDAQRDAFVNAMSTICALKAVTVDTALIPAIKTRIHDLSLAGLSLNAAAAMESAATDYRAKDGKKGFGKVKSIGDFAFNYTFGLFSNRSEIIEDRLAAVKCEEGQSIMTSAVELLKLLEDDTTGNNLASFRYFLASYLVEYKAETDAEAAVVVQIVREALSSKLDDQQVSKKEKDASASSPRPGQGPQSSQ